MDEQEFEAALSLLVAQMEEEDADGREILMRLTSLLNGMRALGMPLPAYLVAIQADMAAEFTLPDGENAAGESSAGESMGGKTADEA
jgi:hypothetical protein